MPVYPAPTQAGVALFDCLHHHGELFEVYLSTAITIHLVFAARLSTDRIMRWGGNVEWKGVGQDEMSRCPLQYIAVNTFFAFHEIYFTQGSMKMGYSSSCCLLCFRRHILWNAQKTIAARTFPDVAHVLTIRSTSTQYACPFLISRYTVWPICRTSRIRLFRRAGGTASPNDLRISPSSSASMEPELSRSILAKAALQYRACHGQKQDTHPTAYFKVSTTTSNNGVLLVGCIQQHVFDARLFVQMSSPAVDWLHHSFLGAVRPNPHDEKSSP